MTLLILARELMRPRYLISSVYAFSKICITRHALTVDPTTKVHGPTFSETYFQQVFCQRDLLSLRDLAGAGGIDFQGHLLSARDFGVAASFKGIYFQRDRLELLTSLGVYLARSTFTEIYCQQGIDKH